MSESLAQPEVSSRWHRLRWFPGVFFRPANTFAQIINAGRVWLLPLLTLTLTSLARVLVEGSIRQAQAQAGGIPLPPDFQYYPPEMQARFTQAMQATQSPVFFYVFPAIIALLGIWVGWLLVSGLLHLSLTMLGGRGDTAGASNIVAWASLPFALRDLVRFFALLFTRQLIQNPGLSGFIAADAGRGMAYIGAFLGLIDFYLLWHILLLAIGARVGNGLSAGKAFFGVLACIILILAAQALFVFLGGQFVGLEIIRPFY